MIQCHLQRMMHTPQGPQMLEIDLKIEKGSFVSLHGASGAGKSTILRMLAGLLEPQSGHLEVDGEVWFDSRRKINRSVQSRQLGFVFQETNLFPHMTVRQNLEFACREKSDREGLEEWFSLAGLKGMENQKPGQLSGGQKQRVALVRALVHRPKLLLLDEPLSDLDAASRLNLQDEILKVYQKTKVTTILVSHDLREVFKLAQKVFLIDQGKILKSGSPEEVFVNNEVSGKFKFTGEILDIQKQGVVNVLTLSIGNQITKVIASDEEIAGLSVGSQVIVAAKAFNPLIFKA